VRIHRVRIDNFRCLRDFEVDFCDAAGAPRPLTVLVGPNMSGKTTVLDALHLVDAGLLARTATFRQGFDPDDLSLRGDPKRPIAVQLEFSLDTEEQDAIEGLLGNLTDAAVALERRGPYRLDFEWPRPSTMPADMSALREIEPSTGKPWFIWYALLGRALAREARAKRLGSEGVFERVGGLIYLDQHRSAELRVPSVESGSEERASRAGRRRRRDAVVRAGVAARSEMGFRDAGRERLVARQAPVRRPGGAGDHRRRRCDRPGLRSALAPR
jgi:hypothetical protein